MDAYDNEEAFHEEEQHNGSTTYTLSVSSLSTSSSRAGVPRYSAARATGVRAVTMADGKVAEERSLAVNVRPERGGEGQERSKTRQSEAR